MNKTHRRRGGMSKEMIEWQRAVLDSELDRAEILAAFALGDHFDRAGSCNPGLPRIARMARMSEPHTSRALKTLAAAGWTRVEMPKTRGRVGETCRYAMTFPAWHELHQPEVSSGCQDELSSGCQHELSSPEEVKALGEGDFKEPSPPKGLDVDDERGAAVGAEAPRPASITSIHVNERDASCGCAACAALPDDRRCIECVPF